MNTKFTNARILKTDVKNHKFTIEQGELWVKGNEIAYIGAGSDAKEELKFDRVIDCENNLLMPGFKNAHTHTAMTFLRSYADDLPLQEWLYNQIFPNEAKLVEDDVYWLNILGIMEYLTSGITSNFDMYFFPPKNAKASMDTGFRTVLTSGLNNFGGTPETVEEHYHIVNEMSELTSFIIGFHAEYTTSMELMEGVAKLCDKLKSPMYMHNSETELEVKECIERWGKTPTQLTDSLDMYKYGGGGYHCVWMDDKDFEIFKNKGLYAVTNPGSNTKLASGIAPIKEYLEWGIPVAIGTDGPASNNCLDMFREMFLVTGLAKLKNMDASSVEATEVLKMATVNGAHAMGLMDSDVLAEGKLADIIMLDLYQPNMQPINNIQKNIVYSGSKSNVMMTMIGGIIRYENGKFNIGEEPSDIYKKAEEISKRIYS